MAATESEAAVACNQTGVYDSCPKCAQVYTNVTPEVSRHLHGVCTLNPAASLDPHGSGFRSLVVHSTHDDSNCPSLFDGCSRDTLHLPSVSALCPLGLGLADSGQASSLFEDSDEEAIVEECWKEIRRASRRTRSLKKFKHLRNSRKPVRKPIEQIDSVDQPETAPSNNKISNSNNNNQSSRSAVEDSAKEDDAKDDGVFDRDCSPGPPERLQFHIPDDIIYADESITYSTIGRLAGKGPLAQQLPQEIQLEGSFGEESEEDSSFSSSGDESDQRCWKDKDEPVYEVIPNSVKRVSNSRPDSIRQRAVSTEIRAVVGARRGRRASSATITATVQEKTVSTILNRHRELRKTLSIGTTPTIVDEASMLEDIQSLSAPTLPSPPDNLSEQQIKRRHVVQTLLESENSYVDTLKRLVYDYQNALLDADPVILPSSKVKIIFYCLGSILKCHSMLRVGLLGAMAKWNDQEKIGDALCGFLSSSVLLEVYSQFVNNFSLSMETAKKCTVTKPLFRQFLKTKQNSYNDRLPFFGLMIKPVQRFPQYIMLLQDLIKHTPSNHSDHVPLMRAFTLLESLTEVLNYRKLVSEQQHAAAQVQKAADRKFRFLNPPRFLNRTQTMELRLTDKGLVSNLKPRTLIIFDSHLICARNIEKTFEMTSCIGGSAASDDFAQSGAALHIKWTYPLHQVQLLTEKNLGKVAGSSVCSITSTDTAIQEPATVTSLPVLFSDLSNLIHDFAVIRNVGYLIAALKGQYDGLNQDLITDLSLFIKEKMKSINEAISLMDRSRIQLVLPSRIKDGPPIRLMYQLPDMNTKLHWIEQFISARLRFDQIMRPCWDRPREENSLIFLRPPNFLRPQMLFRAEGQKSRVLCCAFTGFDDRNCQLAMFIEDGSSNSVVSLLFLSIQREIYDVITKTTRKEDFASGTQPLSLCCFDQEHLVAVFKNPRKLSVLNTTTIEFVASFDLADEPISAAVIAQQAELLVGFSCGKLRSFSLKEGQIIEQRCFSASQSPVSCICPVSSGHLHIASSSALFIYSCPAFEHEATYQLCSDKEIQHLSVCCGALWVAFKDSPILKLYEAVGIKHLQDLDVSVSVNKSLSGKLNSRKMHKNSVALQELASRLAKEVFITVLQPTLQGMWVGTSVGVTVLYPLPRLGGYPVVNSPGMVSLHNYNSPVAFITATQFLIKKYKHRDGSSNANATITEGTCEKGDPHSWPSSPTPTPPLLHRNRQLDQNSGNVSSPTMPEELATTVDAKSAAMTAEAAARIKSVSPEPSAALIHSLRQPGSIAFTHRWGSLMNLPHTCDTQLEDIALADDMLPSSLAPTPSPKGCDAPLMPGGIVGCVMNVALATIKEQSSSSPIEKAQHMLNDSFSTMFEGKKPRKHGHLAGKLFGIGGPMGCGASAPNFADKLVKFSTRRISKESNFSTGSCSAQTSPKTKLGPRDSGYSSFTNFDRYLSPAAGTAAPKSPASSSRTRQLVITGGTGCSYWPDASVERDSSNPYIMIWDLNQ